MFPSELDQCPHAPPFTASTPWCVPNSLPALPLTSKPGKLLSFYSGPNNGNETHQAEPEERKNPGAFAMVDAAADGHCSAVILRGCSFGDLGPWRQRLSEHTRLAGRAASSTPKATVSPC
jgi:hypothetical protein